MRRNDREITDRQEIEKILLQAAVVRLAMVDDGSPYLVAMNFAYDKGVLYMHSAKEGRKIDVLRQDNRVAFQMDVDVRLVHGETTCGCTTTYRSVVGEGRIELVEDMDGIFRALDALMKKYADKTDCVYDTHVLGRTLVLKLTIGSMTGKHAG